MERKITLIGEVKYRQTTKFSLNEARKFEQKAAELIRLEDVESYQLFVFSSAGFKPKILDYFREKGIAWSDDLRWLDSINDKW